LKLLEDGCDACGDNDAEDSSPLEATYIDVAAANDDGVKVTVTTTRDPPEGVTVTTTSELFAVNVLLLMGAEVLLLVTTPELRVLDGVVVFDALENEIDFEVERRPEAVLIDAVAMDECRETGVAEMETKEGAPR
jgi:hypothetical protein